MPPNRSLLLSDDPATLRSKFAAMATRQDVATLLDLTYPRLVWLIWRSPAADRFNRFTITKRKGGLRLIAAPNAGLRILQTKLAQVLKAVYEPRNSVHGFIDGRSILTNARKHANKRLVLNVDLEEFFPSIHFGRIRGLFASHPFNLPPTVATVLAQICTAGEVGLPQGAPTSPVVANMMCASMDRQLEHLAAVHRCTYTRYADDISLSTSRSRMPASIAIASPGGVALGADLSAILTASGFSPHARKLRLQTRLERQDVTGLTVNRFPNVRRRYVRQVRAMIRAIREFGLPAAQAAFRARWDKRNRGPRVQPPKFEDVVVGKLAFLGMIRGRDDQVYSRLVQRARVLLTALPFAMTHCWSSNATRTSLATSLRGLGSLPKGSGS